MQILSAEQIRQWDQYSIQKEAIASVDLMERAASACVSWMDDNRLLDHSFTIFCGKGNNGGDGLAIARMLAEKKSQVIVYILEFGFKGTDDFQINLARLHQSSVDIRFIQTEENIRPMPSEDIIIDALFGSGLNKPLSGLIGQLVMNINESGNPIISIDLPSGMYVDQSSQGNKIIRASHTLSFQCIKPAFLMAENELFVGELHILDIGLDQDFPAQLPRDLELIDLDFIHAIYRPRRAFAHKGNFGHALLVAGSAGKMGAALLAAKACLRSGSGLLTCHIPGRGLGVIQTGIPEAMASDDEMEDVVSSIPEDLSKFKSLGVGPGIGQSDSTQKLLKDLLGKYKSPMVLDADALNILSEH
ncbi:MAG: NAD(P)H-hydrate epimerase, partial [Chitinophagales bacterium]